MYTSPKNDNTIIDALREQTRGNLVGAERLFREAGNQERSPKEKQLLWDAAKHAEWLRRQE